MEQHTQKPNEILHTLHRELLKVTDQLEKTLQQKSLNLNDIGSTIDYLNDTIRKLDHAVEHLLQCKSTA